MTIINAKMNEIMYVVASKLLSCEYKEFISSYSKNCLQSIIDTKESSGYLNVEFCEGNNNYVTLYLMFDEFDESLDLIADDNGNMYKDYIFKPKINWGSWGQSDLEDAKQRIELMNKVLQIGEELLDLYRDDIIRHVHSTAEEERIRKENNERNRNQGVARKIVDDNSKNLRVGKGKVISEEESNNLLDGFYNISLLDRDFIVTKANNITTLTRVK